MLYAWMAWSIAKINSAQFPLFMPSTVQLVIFKKCENHVYLLVIFA